MYVCASCLLNFRDVQGIVKFMPENRAPSVSKIQMYVRETSLAGKTRVVTNSRRFRVKEKKKGDVAICKAPKHHVDDADLEVVFVRKYAEGVSSRFSYF